ncbi:MAG: hypothetical protein H6557_00345 [Lewinellaceae bacterium]|nr:hypothetical protein [Phaeodactylibacter sp.]MCB9035048.1 hypothetical protein [Lewinellaceae bacterium]
MKPPYLSARNITLGALLLLAILATFLVRHNAFFWDTIQLGSKHAHWYYENDFRYLLLPDEIDSGHPPAFGLYLAVMWKLLGKSLAVSHLAMLPFLLGIVILLFRIGDYFGGRENSWMLALLAAADPVLAGQAVLVSPDIVLACFFLLALYGMLCRQSGAQILGAMGLAAISTRGMMVVVALYLFGLAITERKSWAALIRQALPYVPSGLLALAFLAYHYQQKGWIGYHEAMPWAPGFERVGLQGFLKNAAVLGWRMLDFGRLFIWLPLGWLAYWQLKGPAPAANEKIRQAFWLMALCLPLLSITFLAYKGLHGHRYLLPAFLSITMLFYTLLAQGSLTVRVRRLLFGAAFAGLLTGNLWIYPDTISQGWDSTLAHLPYYGLRKQALSYLEEHEIPLESVGTAFPEIGPLKFKELNDEERGMKEKDLARDSFIFYSNVMNDFSDAEIRRLKAEWRVEKCWEKWGVRVVLYGRAE